jgi:hypothetical protein
MTVADIVRDGDEPSHLIRLEFAPSAAERNRQPFDLP